MVRTSLNTDDLENVEKPNFEPPTQQMKSMEAAGDCLQIKGLTKEFDTGKTKLLAVNNLNLTMYKG